MRASPRAFAPSSAPIEYPCTVHHSLKKASSPLLHSGLANIPIHYSKMTTAEPILLYTAKICPYAARAELALEEAGVPWERYEIDLLNKPEWYESKVNKASKGKPVPLSTVLNVAYAELINSAARCSSCPGDWKGQC